MFIARLKVLTFLVVAGCTTITMETQDLRLRKTLFDCFVPGGTQIDIHVYGGDERLQHKPAERLPDDDQAARDPNAGPNNVAFGAWFPLTSGAIHFADVTSRPDRFYLGRTDEFVLTSEKVKRVNRPPP
jgi:hypothetical protein